MSQFEKDTVAANKLFVEAVQLVNSAENAKRPDEQVVVKPARLGLCAWAFSSHSVDKTQSRPETVKEFGL
jgi:predicted Zn-ribbon and HTH transcriptional regulator